MRYLLIAAALLVAPSLTRAEPKKDATDMHTDDCAKARKLGRECVIDMGKEDVKGEKPKNPTEDVSVATWGKAGSLIRLRKDFITEILRSAEDL
jgi:hypothetical protein